MIGPLFALSLLCTTPVSDAAPPPMPEACEDHLTIEWAGRGLSARPVRSDTTLHVDRGLTLVLAGMNGDIRVATWARPQMRVVAEHPPGDRVVLRRSGRRLHLEAVRPGGVADPVDWNLTVPEWLPLHLSCLGGDVEVEGTQASLEVAALSGDVRVKDARGPLSLNSVEGQVRVIDTRGRVTASSINNDVRLTRVQGPIDAQSVNGSIRMEQLEALEVAASSVNGRVWFVGPFLPQGRYTFTSHNGELVLGVPEGQGAQVRVHSYQGEVQSRLPGWTAPPRSESRSFRFTLGEGGSEVDLESFNGLIQLMRDGDVEERLRRLDERLQSQKLLRAAPRGTRAPRAPRAPSPPAPAPVDPPDER